MNNQQKEKIQQFAEILDCPYNPILPINTAMIILEVNYSATDWLLQKLREHHLDNEIIACYVKHEVDL